MRNNILPRLAPSVVLLCAVFHACSAPTIPAQDVTSSDQDTSNTQLDSNTLDQSSETSLDVITAEITSDTPLDTPQDTVSDQSQPDAMEASIPPDVVIDHGQCGMQVWQCRCGCGTNTLCHQGCIQSNQDCVDCIYVAASQCCPGPTMALEQCIVQANCKSQTCVMQVCAQEYQTWQSCVGQAEQTDPMCQQHIGVCLGAGYPLLQCI